MGSSTVQVRVHEKDLIRVLVIDDDTDFQEMMRGFWERKGCAVKIASNFIEGQQQLNNYTFEIIIADVRFKFSKLTGDEFILQNQSNLREAKVFVVTAQGLNNVKNYNALHRLGYKVLDKSDLSFDETLKEAAIEKSKERKSSIEAVVRAAVSSKIGKSTIPVSVIPVSDDGRVAELEGEEKENPTLEIFNEEILKTQGTLGSWLRARSSPDDPVIAMGSKVMSANELADAVETGKESGIALIRLFMSEFNHHLMNRLKKE